MTPAPRITLASVGRYHYGTLASLLWRRGALQRFYSGFPRSRMGAPDVPRERLWSWPWRQLPTSLGERWGLLHGRRLQAWQLAAQISLDRRIARTLPDTEVFAALSGCAVAAGAEARRRGIRVICERGSEHIRVADERLRAEFACWNLPYAGSDPATIEREEAEYAQADRIIVISDANARSFITAGIAPDKLRVVAPRIAIDFPAAPPPPHPADAGLRVLFVGALSVIKGFGHLLTGFARAALPGARLRVVGSPVGETAALLAQCPRHDVDLLGVMSPAEVAAEMRGADVLVVPSISDGLPLVVFEALANGCPVILSDLAGAAGQVRDGDHALVIRGGDSDALATALRRLHDDRELLSRLRAGAARIAGTTARDDAYVERWLDAVWR